MSPTRSSSCRGVGLDLLLSLASGSPSVLLTSGDGLKVSATTSSGGVSPLGLGGPVISSLLGVETTTRLGVLSLLLVEVGSSSESGNAMGMSVLLTSRRSTSSLKV